MKDQVYCWIFFALLCFSTVTNVQAQDSLPCSPFSCVSSGMFVTAGSVLTFVPDAKAWTVDLRDAVQADGHDKLMFDNYLQYLPAISPPILNVCGLHSKHNLRKMIVREGASYLLGAVLLNAAKYGFRVQRPDGTAFNSFPSGHTFTAFTGAEILRREYGKEYPWVAVAGYAVATLVGTMRVYNNRHWAGDVLAGAGLGIFSVGVVYFLF